MCHTYVISNLGSACCTGQHGGVAWQWLLHWYVLAGAAVVGLLAAANWYDARLAGVSLSSSKRLSSLPDIMLLNSVGNLALQRHTDVLNLNLNKYLWSRVATRDLQYNKELAQ